MDLQRFGRSAVASLIAIGALSGCASTQSPVGNGLIFTSVKAPVTATSLASTPNTKTGRSSCVNLMGVVAIGDASIEAASKEAGITRVQHVDHESFSVLGLFGKYTCVVYGDNDPVK